MIWYGSRLRVVNNKIYSIFSKAYNDKKDFQNTLQVFLRFIVITSRKEKKAGRNSEKRVRTHLTSHFAVQVTCFLYVGMAGGL
jgi:hypothetical protein